MTYYANCCPHLFIEKKKHLPKCFKLFFRLDEREQFRKASLFTNKLGSKRWFIHEFVNKFKGGNSWGISSKIENEWVLWILEAGHKLLSLTEKYSLKNHLSFPDFPSWHNLSKEWCHLHFPHFPGAAWSSIDLLDAKFTGHLLSFISSSQQYSAQLTTSSFGKYSFLLDLESPHPSILFLTVHSSGRSLGCSPSPPLNF